MNHSPLFRGFPALSASGGFLIKDVILFGAAVWSLGEALTEIAKKEKDS